MSINREQALHLARGLRDHEAICKCREGRAWMRWAADALTQAAAMIPSVDDPPEMPTDRDKTTAHTTA